MDTKAIDINCKYLGISTLQLMENAGKEIAKAADKFKSIAVFCGTGNNGGDGFVAARHLAGTGKDVEVYTFKGKKSDAAEYNFKILQNMGTPIHYIDFFNFDLKGKKKELQKFDCIIDALIGVGISGELREPMKSIVNLINSMDAYKIAVDVPTGNLKANLIISFHSPKEFNKGKNERVVDIGIPRDAETYCGPGDVFSALPKREGNEHKGDFGRLLVIGGSRDYIGAPVLTTLGAMRTGTDLVFLNCPEIAAKRISDPNFIINSFENDYLNSGNIDSILKKYNNDFDAVVLGNGISTHKQTKDAVLKVIKKIKHKPIVLDADALKAVKPENLNENIIITPHSGEFKILFDEDISELNLNEKIKIIEEFAAKTSATIVLKGKVDIISNGTQTKLNRTGNAAMTVGGTGDVLAGIIAGMIAQNKGKIFESCCGGAFLCGLAGDFAKEDLMYLRATDVVDRIPEALKFCGDFF